MSDSKLDLIIKELNKLKEDPDFLGETMSNSLKEEIIELYADFNYINKRCCRRYK